MSLPFTAGLRFVTSISGWSSPWPVRCGMRPHPDGGTCAGGGPRCTGAHASVWSGKAGGPRYCKSKACIDLGKERGHIAERETTPGSAKGKRKQAEVDDRGDPSESEAWWPTTIDFISSAECVAACPTPVSCASRLTCVCASTRTACRSRKRARRSCPMRWSRCATTCTAGSGASRVTMVFSTRCGARNARCAGDLPALSCPPDPARSYLTLD